MAAPGIVLTIARVAEMLGESEDLLREIAEDMDPEQGCLWVMGVGDDETIAFTPDGVNYIRDNISDYKTRE